MSQANSYRSLRHRLDPEGYTRARFSPDRQEPPTDRPTPHFFWQDVPGNENDPDFDYPLHQEHELAGNRHQFDSKVFQAPSWFMDNERKNTGRRGAIVIAALLTVSCGVGLGLLLLQLQSAGNRGPQSPLALATLQAPASGDTEPVQAKTIDARVAADPATLEIPPAPVASTGKTNRQGQDLQTAAIDTTTVARTEAPADTATLDPAILELRQRAGEQMLNGDVISARSFFMKAVKLGDVGSAYELARSYDPDVVTKMNAIGPQANPQLALHWYRQASAGGHEAATQWLKHLQTIARQAAN